MCNLLLKGNHSYVEVLLGNGVNLEKVAGKIPDLKASETRFRQLQRQVKEERYYDHIYLMSQHIRTWNASAT